ncbi:MAG TPA: hypothetical protein PKD85_00200 [Saprospiraceae bacterium]|nr:hypothetical protein [Saprospiraceae bacterium]
MAILSFFALASGFIFFDLFVGYGAFHFFEPNLKENYYILLEFLTQRRKFMPLFVAVFSCFCFFFFRKYTLFIFLLSIKSVVWSFLYNRLLTFFNKKWYFDYFYFFIAKSVLYLSYNVLFKNFDKGLLEKVFVKKVVWFILKLGNKIRFVQTGSLTDYLMLLVSTIIFIGVIPALLSLDSYVFLILYIFYLGYLLCKK